MYKVTYTNPFFADTIEMPLAEGTSATLSRGQIVAILNKYNLGYYAKFMQSGEADKWIDERGAWSQQVNGWFIVVEKAQH